ncbi:MAG: (deoxy)nucleoside triphosphate pyrophosphohydrolase [Treponema sp.]|jgi:8-oxo-dGTP diphosphatase|nr:(deoxy)nucleoside triphosphate pyrophosphohydrolase [Treponema sp.]
MAGSVAGIAFEDGRFFIARRKAGGDLGGKWEFPGGKVEQGESDEEALRREYLEEFGVPIRTGPFLGSASFEHHGKIRRVNAYRVYLPGGDLTLCEHTRCRWADPEEIGTLDFAESDVKLLPALRSALDL